MNFKHTFWLFGLTAVMAMPIAQNHCAGSAEPQAVTASATSNGTPIHASSKPTGIIITGVN